MNKGMLAMLMVDTLTRGSTAGDGRLTLAEPSGRLEPPCDLCAAPGAQRHALEIEPGETPEP